MRSTVFFICLFLGSSLIHSQELPPLSKDAQAEKLALQVLSANGPALPPGIGTVTAGTIQFAGNTDLVPVRILTQGTDRIRTEVDTANGTSVRIVNQGEGSFQWPNGRVIHLNPLNTLSERISHIPAFSILAEDALPNVKLEYIGPVQVFGVPVVQLAVSWSNAVTAKDQAEFLKRTRTIYSIDPATLRIIQIQFDRCAEHDTNALTHFRVMYSDYRTLNGRLVPTKVITFANDAFTSELHIASYQENAAVSSTSFDPQEATK
jgi:hypothetical protein